MHTLLCSYNLLHRSQQQYIIYWVTSTWHDGHPGIWSQRKTLLKELDTWILSFGQKWLKKILMTCLWLSLAKNNKIFMPTELGFILVKNSLREFLCQTGQIKINELILWPKQILRVVWYLECLASYVRTEQIDSSELKVVRGILISKSKGEEGAWMASWLKEVG